MQSGLPLLFLLLVALVLGRRPKPKQPVIKDIPQKILFPALSSVPRQKKSGRKWIVIATVDKYKDALDYCLDALKPEWPLHKVILVFNASPKFEIHGTLDTQKEGMPPIRVHTTKNLFEYTSFMAPVWLDAPANDCFFMMHDTCVPKKNFGVKVAALMDEFSGRQSDIHWCTGRGHCNISIIRRKIAERFLHEFGGMETMEKGFAIDLEIVAIDQSPKKWQEFVQTGEQYSPIQTPGVVLPYSTFPRVRVDYVTINMDKYYRYHGANDPHPNKLK